MAIIDPWNMPIDIQTTDYDIAGIMLKHDLFISEYELMKIDPQKFQYEIKKRLMIGLLDEIARAKCVEFTKQPNFEELKTHFRARMFVVPDDQVRILRLSQINNNG